MLFKCLRSGNTVDIEQQDDIDRMKTHEGYELVKEIQHEEETKAYADEVPVQVPHEEEVLKVVKQRGRPKKAAVVLEVVDEI